MAVVNASSNAEPIKPKHGKVILLLENCILPQEKLSATPSGLDGLDPETETNLRILGCELIQTSGILLRLPQVAMATGQVLFQRFYFSKSFVRHSMEIVAMACVTLASKIEEAPRRIRDVINVFHHIKQVRGRKTIQPLILDQNYINLKNQVIKAERRVLKELGFCVHVKHPHKIIVTLLQVLECEKNTNLMQTSWNYMNDSLRTDIFVRHSPETIACACIYLSARLLQIPLPNKPAWFSVFGVSEEDILYSCKHILSIYTRKRPDADALERKVEELKKAYIEAKLKAKGISGNNTPILGNGTSFSPSSRNNSPRQSPLNDAAKKKEDGKIAAERSPRVDRATSNHIPSATAGSKHKSSPSSPPPRKKDHRHGRGSSSSSSGGALSPPASRAEGKTPPRSYKEPQLTAASPSRSRSRERRKETSSGKHHSSHKRKRSTSTVRSRSRSPPRRHSSKKSGSHKGQSGGHKSPSTHNHHHHHHHSSKSKKERSRETHHRSVNTSSRR